MGNGKSPTLCRLRLAVHLPTHRSMETEVLGLCIEAAAEARLADLVSQLI